ncbi:MAG: DUF86 domain-containing protein [Flavobacteriales bacterium]|nr:DUF86 domain-containing protein [Flavobacteriales bacterium]
MSKRFDKPLLIDMLQSGEKVLRTMSGVDFEAFLANEVLRDATAYRLQVIGGAAYKVSDTVKEEHPEVEWFKIQGLRHKIVHDYYALDDRTIHHIAVDYVPPLVEQLKKILEAGVE